MIKDYYVNSNGDVLRTTKNPFSPKPTSTTPIPSTTPRKNPFRPVSLLRTKAESPTTVFSARSVEIPFVADSIGKLNRPESFTTNDPVTTTTTTKKFIKEDILNPAKPVTVPPDQLFTLSAVGYDEVDDDYYISSAENSTASLEYDDEIGDGDYAVESTPALVTSTAGKLSSATQQLSEIETTATEEPTTTEKDVTVTLMDEATVESYVTTTEMEDLTTALPVIAHKLNGTVEEGVPEDEEYVEEYYDYEDSGNYMGIWSIYLIVLKNC